jgi:hypothetical protein
MLAGKAAAAGSKLAQVDGPAAKMIDQAGLRELLQGSAMEANNLLYGSTSHLCRWMNALRRMDGNTAR